MTLPELSIKRPVMAWMLMAALIIFGGISALRMGVSQLPDVDYPIITVSCALNGAAPEVMETEVADVIEGAIMTVQGVKKVTSSSGTGRANVVIEFELSRDIDVALQEVQAKVAAAARKLPKDMDPPSISKTNPEDNPIIMVAVSSDSLPTQELMSLVRDQLQDRFTTVDGVGAVNIMGYLDPQLRIWVSGPELKRYQLAVGDVINTVANEHVEQPSGRIESAKKEFNVRTLGRATTVEDFGKMLVNTRGGGANYAPIPLNKVARIEDGTEDVRRMARMNSKPAVGLGIIKQRGTNAVAVAKAVKARMAELKKQVPAGVSLDINYDSTKFIEDSVSDLELTLLLSALATALVCWAFLGSLSSLVNILLAIPTSIIGTFIVLYFAGFTLNTFTLLGLSLAIGIVVDDAIMVLENIIRYMEKGKGKVDAALTGANEIQFAAMAATIAIVAIFLPVAFMSGIIGKYFFQFGVTMTVAVLLSLLEALTLTPMRCSQFVSVGEHNTRIGRIIEGGFKWAAEGYRANLAVALEHRWLVVAGAVLAAGGLGAFGWFFISKEMIPAQDQSSLRIRIQAPVGTALPVTNEAAKVMEAFLASRPEIERYFAVAGAGSTNVMMAFVTLKDRGKRGIEPTLKHTASQQELMGIFRKELKDRIKGMRVVIQDPSQVSFGSGSGFPVEFAVQGPDWDQLAVHAKALMEALDKSGLVTDLDTDYQEGMPEVQVIPDRAKCSSRGVSMASIAQAVGAMVGGVTVGQYPKAGRLNDIVLRLEPGERDKADQIKQLFVRNNRGELVRLADLVRLEVRDSLQSINRLNRQRSVTVKANVKAGASQAAALDKAQELGRTLLPTGYKVVLSGSSSTFLESFGSLFLALVLGIVVAYMVLASQFNSYLDPVTVLMALPFSVTGAFLGLLLPRLWGHPLSLNIFSMIGLILLMGIVKKNSILLVDFTNNVADSGKAKGAKEALLAACPVRFRPIMMTSFATIAAAIPPAMGMGAGSETRVPMAMTVIFGVLVSTFLTLFVVPCVYSLFSPLEKRFRDQKLKKTPPPAPPRGRGER